LQNLGVLNGVSKKFKNLPRHFVSIDGLFS
jgi:hypothetical protein